MDPVGAGGLKRPMDAYYRLHTFIIVTERLGISAFLSRRNDPAHSHVGLFLDQMA